MAWAEAPENQRELPDQPVAEQLRTAATDSTCLVAHSALEEECMNPATTTGATPDWLVDK